MNEKERIRALLVDIYGADRGPIAAEKILPIVDRVARRRRAGSEARFSEKDVVLITYADSVKTPGEVPLATLNRFATRWFKEIFSTLHILPFFPWSTDDGFAVIDFTAVDPAYGRWADIQRLGESFRLMFDFVLNHVSAESPWFMNYLDEIPGYEDLAIEVDPSTDLSRVTRPRTLPLLTPFEKRSGKRAHVWTTFSEDQIDLNYKSLEVLERMVQVLLFYVHKGARMIRMDAVAYLWKEIGTPCIHLPQTHAMVKLFRKILDVVAPDTLIVTETNVPHQENISYFGQAGDEAQLVYNFSLPPLLLHALARGTAEPLSDWAGQLCAGHPDTTFFNFTASHDGIGVRPLEGILPRSETEFLVDRVLANGGRISLKVDSDGSESPYELNITYLDALKNPGKSRDPLHARRFLASQAVAQVLPGIPGVYVHSILGSRNWREGVAETGRARAINRQKLVAGPLEEQLLLKSGERAAIFFPYREMIRIRRSQPAFHPNADFAALDLAPEVFAVLRTAEEQQILAVTNVSERAIPLDLSIAKMSGELTELVSGRRVSARDRVTLAPYQYAWFSEAK